MNDPLRRASLLLQQDRYDLALSEIERHLAEFPDNSSGHALRSYCLTELAQSKEAEEAARQAIELEPDDPFGFYVLSRALKARKDLRGAMSAIETALEIHPGSNDYWLQKAAVQFTQYRWKDAIASIDESLSIDAESAEALLLRSHALHALGRTTEAAGMSRMALVINPELAMGHFEQGWALLRMGKARAAEQQFLEALRIDADLKPAREGLKEAVRSRFLPYRWITGYRHWLRRFPPKFGVGIILGAMIVINVLPKIAPKGTAYHDAAIMIVIAYVSFAYLTWIVGPLSNFFLRFHPQGQHALTDNERHGTYVLGAIFAGAALLATGWLTTSELRLSSVMACLGLAVPGSAIFANEGGKPRRIMALITAGLFLMGPVPFVLSSFSGPIPVDSALGAAILFGAENFWLGVALSTWISAGMAARE